MKIKNCMLKRVSKEQHLKINGIEIEKHYE